MVFFAYAAVPFVIVSQLRRALGNETKIRLPDTLLRTRNHHTTRAFVVANFANGEAWEIF